ncbi:Fimbrillin-like [Xylanibacter ruminicola]|uniref:Fimbrillin-like n=1 Tax=Xylanibacter ruminicola TaxID=839 RepID=A0A1M7DSK0_XYLRU|nr:fimbrillin family protein [Xylanibacter ruminicola]SHL82407.1 Fimbrillin-like [Xylanibacter ruminicola]
MIIRKYFILSLSVLLLAGCAGNDISDTPDEERLPLRFETTLSNQLPVTRAVDNKIDASDELLCYVRHVINSETSVYTQVQGNLVTIKDNKPTTALYWDDFSNSNSAETDLRTANHGLQSYYGYCYNGATVAKDALKDVSGELTWSASTNQSADGIKTSDLLWSSVQTLVPYDHAKIESIKVPYTHAMSKFTVIVVAGDGFTSTDLDKAKVTLHDMQTKGTFTAPSAEVSATKTDNVTMYGTKRADDANQRAFEVVVLPTSSLAKDKHLATITMAGNTYKVNITDAMLTSWAKGIENAASQSGINYQLTVTLNKQAISVSASLAAWTSVEATAVGEILFDPDVKTIGKNYENVKDGDSFALWMAEADADFGTDAATTVTYNGTRFTNDKPVYWPNGTTQFKFRALAKQTNSHLLEAVTATKVKQDDDSKLPDLLWGTSGDKAIAPRTGDVPLTFSHAMSNVVVKLETSNDDKSKVEIDKATIRITDLKTDGTIAISSGDISIGNTVGEVAVDGETIMVPQTISTDAKLIITLADKKTTYSLKLSTIDNITKWVRGNQYTYTIHLEKEAMKFRAVIEPWVGTTGSGDATLDWED